MMPCNRNGVSHGSLGETILRQGSRLEQQLMEEEGLRHSCPPPRDRRTSNSQNATEGPRDNMSLLSQVSADTLSG